MSTKSNSAEYYNRVLAVDDDPTSLFLIEQQLIDLGYEVDCVTNGADALARLKADPDGYPVLVLDRLMPGMDGLEVAKAMNVAGLTERTQIVMLSGADSQEEMRQGIEAGVFYYLVKPTKIGLLKSVLGAAFKQSFRTRTLDANADTFELSETLEAAQFRYRTLDDAHAVARFATTLFPDPQRAAAGIDALLVNAVEHGLAEIGFERKGELIAEGRLNEEIGLRLSDPNRAEKSIEAKIARKDDGVYFVVSDPGPGFAWRSFLMPDQSRSNTTHGRGIAQARVRSFTKLSYNETGNVAVGFASHTSEIDW